MDRKDEEKICDVIENFEECLRCFYDGRYCNALSKFDEKSFSKDWWGLYFIVFSFVRRFNRRDFKELNHDPIMSMIAAEIWLFNIGNLLKNKKGDLDPNLLLDDKIRSRILPKCNAYSLSQYLHIPNQTVRRKVLKLIEMGWVSRSDNGDLMITSGCEENFVPEFILETMRDFLSTARTVLKLM